MARENPEPFNRQWTLFALEHGVRLLEIRELLEREIMIRQDVYGWDQLAMARYLTGDVSAAEQAIREAMRIGTQDANLYFHAALIAKARGDVPLAREFARQALSLNPNFHHRDVTRAQAIASAR
jgi:tetratricopeptide (TPR) repeat protein